MKKIVFTIHLKSDAEPGTGAAGDIVNQRIPRNRERIPIIPANHMKGLIREELMKIEYLLGVNGLANRCAGTPGDSEDGENAGKEACFRLTDAVAKTDSTGYVSRTAIDSDIGRAKDGSLRTVERNSIETEFQGDLYLDVNLESQEGIAVRLALLAIEAVGGNRQRGSGLCTITLNNETATPGSLLKQLFDAKSVQVVTRQISFNPRQNQLVAIRLIFEAESPICCPETPVRANVIRSGFTIPSSAVQGFIVSQLARYCGDKAATLCFESSEFRAWPLLPCASEAKEKIDEYPIPIRVSLTHRVAKLAVDGKELNAKTVVDTAIENYDWTQVDGANPLKASDGVLLRNHGDNTVSLWRSRSIPRYPTAHGVINDPETGRNLYQLESIAPLVWSGVALLPEWAVNALAESLKEYPYVSFGRSRTVRGSGRLHVVPINPDDPTLPWKLKRVPQQENDPKILIVQSPILLPDKPDSESIPADDELVSLIEKKWMMKSRCIGVVTGILFGWNRHGLGKMSGKGRRVRACRVVQPGAVIVLDSETVSQSQLENLIRKGLGEGREQGFGAVSLHPGKASRMFDSGKPELRKSRSDTHEKLAIDIALGIWKQFKKELPSVSQLAEIRSRLEAGGKNEAFKYLNRQKNERTGRIWAIWENSFTRFIKFIEETDDCQNAIKGIKLLIDLKIADDKSENNYD